MPGPLTEAWIAVGDNFDDAINLGHPDFGIPVMAFPGLSTGIAHAPSVRIYNASPTPPFATKTVGFSLFMYGDTMDAILANWAEIQKRLDMAVLAAGSHPRGTGVVYIERLIDADEYTYFDVKTGVLTDVDVNLPGTPFWGAVCSLECAQFGRQATQIIIDAGAAPVRTNGTGAVEFWQGIPGDAPAIAEIRVRDRSTGGKNIARLTLARRSYRSMEAADFLPIDDSSGSITTASGWQQLGVLYVDNPGPHQVGLEDLWAMLQDDSPVLGSAGGGPTVARSPGGTVPAVPIRYQFSGVDGSGNEGSLSPATVVSGGQGADIFEALPVEAATLADEGWTITLGSNAAGYTSAAAQDNTAEDTGTFGILTTTACPGTAGNNTFIIPSFSPISGQFPPAARVYQWRARLDTYTPGGYGGTADVGLQLFGGLLVYVNSATPHWTLGLIGPTIPGPPFDGNWHTWQMQTNSLPGGFATTDAYLDGVLLGSTPGFFGGSLGATIQDISGSGASVTYAVDNFAISATLLAITDMATALNQDAVSWPALTGAATYNVYATVVSTGVTYLFSGISGTSMTITELQDGTIFTAPTLAGLPPVAPAQLRVGVGLGHQTDRLYHSPPVRTPVQNSAACMMRLATLTLPPVARAEPTSATPEGYTIVIEGRTGGQNADNLTLGGLWHLPAEQAPPELQQVTASAPGLSTPREWRLTTNRWGHTRCSLHDLDSGVLIASADVDGALNLGHGDNVLLVMAEADDGSGGFVADVTDLKFQVGAIITPCWRLGAVTG